MLFQVLEEIGHWLETAQHVPDTNLEVWTDWQQKKTGSGVSAKEITLARNCSFDSRVSFTGYSPILPFLSLHRRRPHSWTPSSRYFSLPSFCNCWDSCLEVPYFGLLWFFLVLTIPDMESVFCELTSSSGSQHFAPLFLFLHRFKSCFFMAA
jgi:hypothetical protein